jgi:primosomal protein N' (replication factor Y)
MGAVAQVEPLTSTRALRGPFDYLLPAGMQGEVGLGSLLVVPFGRRELPGIVVGIAAKSELPHERLLAPRGLLEGGLPADLVELAEWMAREYCSTRARALALMLPPGAARGARRPVRWVADLTPRGRAVAEGAPEASGEGGSASVEGAAASARGEAASGGRRRAPTERQRMLLSALAGGPRPASTLPGGIAALRRLERAGLVALERRQQERRPRHQTVGARAPDPLPLTAEQEAAYATIARALAAGRAEELLLHGVTGSGKTELYLRAAADALERGRGAVVLVPEIALTPQMVGRVAARLGDTVAVLHSRLSAGERHDEWRRLREGRARVCVGPRSAVFAPVEDLGLVVVDEEHDGSYKHEGDPRYDARRVAAERARRSGALLLLGSATPRPESYASHRRVRLARRVDGRALPRVEILDMRAVEPGLHAQTVQALAEVRAQGGKAIVLLNRRGWSAFLVCRGCGRVWGCPHCDVSLVLHRAGGSAPGRPRAGGARGPFLGCHHCGHREALPERCECGSRALARHGSGTERVERELADLVGGGGFPIFRLDADVTVAGDGRSAAIAPAAGPAVGSRRQAARGAGSGAAIAAQVLRRFERAPAGVLLGTQMVAKGHDFPGVSLGVVLDADSGLAFPDFRAEERTFALIAQLAGRVGRGGEGRVLVQTMAPLARAIVRAADHDSEGFVEGELERRRALAYPPFAELVRVVCSAEEAPRAQAAARAVRERIRERLAGARADAAPSPQDGSAAPSAGELGGTSVLGPAPLFRLRGRERSALLVKTAARSHALGAIDAAVRASAADRAHAGVSFSVDVDPH